MYALSYVPVEQVIMFYEEQILTSVENNLDEEVGDEEWLEVSRELEVFGDYFTRTRIGSAAIICIKIVESMVNCISRWNSLECFNRVWNSQVGQHPNVWKVIDAFIKTELEYRRILLLNAIGKDLHQKYRKEGEIR